MKRNTMSKLIVGGSALALLAACADSSGESAVDGGSDSDTEGGSLVIAGYGGDTAPMRDRHFDQPFTEETGIDVTVEQVPGQQLSGISAQNQAGNIQWDYTGSLAGGDLAIMHEEGFLADMPQDLYDKFGDEIPAVETFGLPTKRGAVRIVCNELLVEACPTNAAEFFDTEQFPGDRMVPSFQPDVAVTLAFAAMGLDEAEMFESDAATMEENVEEAISILEDVKQDMTMFYSSSSEAIQLLQSGEVGIAGLWDGAVKEVMGAPSDRMDIVASWDDAVTYLQWDVVYEGGPNTENAWKYIEWLHDNPERVAEYSAEASSATTHPEAFSLIDSSEAKWMPAPSGERAEKTHEIPPLWMTEDEGRREAIESFWESYIGG